MRILYLGWVGFGNVGDDLMLDIFKDMAKEKYGKDVVVKGKYPKHVITDFDDYDMVVLGGGSNLLEGYIECVYNAIQAGKKVIIWGTGYDEMLGRDFIERLENTNTPPYVFSDSHEEMLSEIAEKAEFFGIRGPLTLDIIRKSFIDTTNIKISGDPGFLLKPADISEKGTKIKFKKEDNIVAINLGRTFDRIFGKNEAKVNESIKEFCIELLNMGYKLYLYAMWETDLKSIFDLYGKLPKSDNIILDSVIHSGGELVTILSNCKYSINFKLHANIISAVANTPFICIGYRLKSYDIMKSLELEELLIPTDDENMFMSLKEKFDYVINNEEKIKAQLESKINEFKSNLLG
ncbi:MAG: polysaccharide pyruvyl transferase family protein [Clostridium sp.]